MQKVNVNETVYLEFLSYLRVSLIFITQMICDTFERSPQNNRIKSEIAQADANPYQLDTENMSKYLFKLFINFDNFLCTFIFLLQVSIESVYAAVLVNKKTILNGF